MKLNNDINEHELWQSFKKGDKKAFDKILHVYYEMLLKYGVRILGNENLVLVEDALQDFFVDLWASHERLGDAKSIKAYLISSFKRRLFREKEKSNRFIPAEDIHENYEFEIQFSIESSIIDAESQEHLKGKLKKMMESLSKRQKEAIYLKFFEKMDYPQIAEIMDINHHSVVNLIYGGIKYLRENWFQAAIPIFWWPFSI